MSKPNLFARGITNAVYDAEFVTRKTNIGGMLHNLARRSKMQAALDSYGPDSSALGRSALQGALWARHIASPGTVCLDMLVGTGRTHFAQGELTAVAEGDTALSHEIRATGLECQKLFKRTHEERIGWLKNRLAQALEHPCDAGLLGVVTGAASLPTLFMISAIGSALGAAAGCAAYMAMRASGKRELELLDTIDDAASWFTGVPAAVIKRFVPGFSVSFNLATRLGLLSLDVSNFVPMYLTLHGCRIISASLKLSISAVGAIAGIAFGLGLSATHAIGRQVQLRQSADCGAPAAAAIPPAAAIPGRLKLPPLPSWPALPTFEDFFA